MSPFEKLKGSSRKIHLGGAVLKQIFFFVVCVCVCVCGGGGGGGGQLISVFLVLEISVSWVLGVKLVI